MAAALCVVAGPATAVQAQPGAPSADPDDDGVAALTEAVLATDDAPGISGEEAVSALDETDTTEIAASNAGLDPEELVEELREDPAMFVTVDAMVGYIEVAEASSADDDAGSDQPMALEACLDPYQLDSLPSSSRVIYLDFNGHTTSGQYWNAAYGQATITSSAYDGDADDICNIWRQVAEDYRPFGVNVTTRDPGVEGLRRTSSGDASFGQRVVVTESNFTGNTSTLGIALINVFDASQDLSAFVFTGSATMNSPANVAEAISHESGHTFGLLHDGISGSEYYDGHNGWAPIMGLPINRAVTQWSKGEYPGATNTQDDLALIAGYTGYRADDVGDTSPATTGVGHTSTTYGVAGPGDLDVFSVDVGAGGLSATLRPDAVGSNLHARVMICDSNGGVVATGSPGSLQSWTAVASASVPAGRYTVIVHPIAWQTPATGFTAYGSAGAYELQIAGAAPSSSPGAVTRGCTSQLTPVTPNRVLDTRHGIGGYSRIAGGQQAVVQIAGTSGVPHGATAAMVNITAVGPSGTGFVTAYPCASEVPTTSNVNYVAGQVVSNSTIAALSPSGQLCVWTSADADILVDVTGWLGATGSSKLTQAGPARVVDTRTNVGGTRLAAGATLQVDFTGWVPAGTTAVSFNITATRASAAAFMTAYPCGLPLPDTSVVNYLAGEDRANNVIVGLGSGNRVCIYSYAESDVIVDMTGYFSPSGHLSYEPTPPDRVLDTRQGIPQPPKPAGSVFSYSVQTPKLGGLDPDAAYVNVTAVDHPNEGFVTTFDCGELPNSSTVNQRVGQANANGAIVPVTASSASCAWLSSAGHLIVDLNGWWVN